MNLPGFISCLHSPLEKHAWLAACVAHISIRTANHQHGRRVFTPFQRSLGQHHRINDVKGLGRANLDTGWTGSATLAQIALDGFNMRGAEGLSIGEIHFARQNFNHAEATGDHAALAADASRRDDLDGMVAHDQRTGRTDCHTGRVVALAALNRRADRGGLYHLEPRNKGCRRECGQCVRRGMGQGASQLACSATDASPRICDD